MLSGPTNDFSIVVEVPGANIRVMNHSEPENNNKLALGKTFAGKF